MKRFFLAALLLFAAVAFTGCDNDDDDLTLELQGGDSSDDGLGSDEDI